MSTDTNPNEFVTDPAALQRVAAAAGNAVIDTVVGELVRRLAATEARAAVAERRLAAAEARAAAAEAKLAAATQPPETPTRPPCKSE